MPKSLVLRLVTEFAPLIVGEPGALLVSHRFDAAEHSRSFNSMTIPATYGRALLATVRSSVMLTLVPVYQPR